MTLGVLYELVFPKLANHQIRHQATCQVGCQPGDCINASGHSILPQAFMWVCMGLHTQGRYGFTYSLYRPRGLNVLMASHK